MVGCNKTFSLEFAGMQRLGHGALRSRATKQRDVWMIHGFLVHIVQGYAATMNASATKQYIAGVFGANASALPLAESSQCCVSSVSAFPNDDGTR